MELNWKMSQFAPVAVEFVAIVLVPLGLKYTQVWKWSDTYRGKLFFWFEYDIEYDAESYIKLLRGSNLIWF